MFTIYGSSEGYRHVVESDPFKEGVEAYKRYEARSDNPYDPEKTDAYHIWDYGYTTAKNGDAL